MRTIPLVLLLGVIGSLLYAHRAEGVVLCQRGNRIVLRAEACLRREVRLPLDADTLKGKSADETLAPLEDRVRALETAVGGGIATSTTSSTTTTVARPGRVTCTCVDLTTQSGCVPQIDCTMMYWVGRACQEIVCAGRGGAAMDGSCDNEDPSCQ